MKKNIIAITTSRSDFGIFEEILNKLNTSNKINLKIIVSGSHLDKKRNNSLLEIKKSKLKISSSIQKKLRTTNNYFVSKLIASYMESFSEIINKKKVDLLVVFGDRYELLSFVIPSIIFKIPILHIGGGEITLGSIDDTIRHAITKFSNIHMVTHQLHKKRLIQLGEVKKNIFVIGSPGYEKVRKISLINKIKLQKILNFKFEKNNILITFHPTTNEIGKDKTYIDELLKSLNNFKKVKKIFTMPNSDVGGDLIKKQIQKFVKKDKRSVMFDSLGVKKYLSCMKYVDCVVGNSSSGIIESPALKKISVNIGDRQKGRIIPKSVINCSNNHNSITRAIKKALNKSKSKAFDYPYRAMNTSSVVCKIIENLKFKNLHKKKFVDINF